MYKFYLLTFGCPKNEVVSENIALKLSEYNFKQTLEIDEANIILVNTCSFITSALDENLKTIENIVETHCNASLRKQPKIVVFGCIPQRFSHNLLVSKYPYLQKIDLWAKNWKELHQYITNVFPEHLTTYPRRQANSQLLPTRLNTFSPYAYVEIALGCSQKCAYCTIPSFKGHYQSKPIQQIINEIKDLIQYDVQEIILIAQETTFYGIDLKPKTSLVNLIRKISNQFPQLPRIRIMYAHPNGITDELIRTIRDNSQVCKYIDIPLQHIDTKILKSMNRFYSEEKVKQIITKLRKEIPDISIRSTFIVGHPGETKLQFMKLKRFLKDFKIDYAGFFAFEKETGTKASTLPQQISQKTKQERLQKIYALQENISKKRNDKLIGKTDTVLTEFTDNDYTYGRTYFQAPEIDGYVKIKAQLEIGKFIKVKITENKYPNLIGKMTQN